MRALLTLALIFFGTLAQAQNCAPREVALYWFENKFGETQQSIGLDSDGALMELFASAETGTWTIIMTLDNGITCMVASGDDFENVGEVLAPGEEM